MFLFTNKRIGQVPNIQIVNEELQYTNSYDIFGIRFNAPKLNLIENIGTITTQNKHYKKNYQHTWDVNRATLLKFYDNHIEPKIEWGITIHRTAKNSEMKKWETLQNTILRIATGILNLAL